MSERNNPQIPLNLLNPPNPIIVFNPPNEPQNVQRNSQNAQNNSQNAQNNVPVNLSREQLLNLIGPVNNQKNNPFMSIGEALKIVNVFKGEKDTVNTFIANVETALDVVSNENKPRLFRFVLTKIEGELRNAIQYRKIETWENLKTFLLNTYRDSRTLDYYLAELFTSKQNRNENVNEWIQRIQKMRARVREGAMLACNDLEKPGVEFFLEYMTKLCCINGLVNDKIQTIIKSRNLHNLNEIAEVALSEEGAMLSRLGKFKTPNDEICKICKKHGHIAAKCYFKKDNETKALHVTEKSKEIVCFQCKQKGHMSTKCPTKNKKNADEKKVGELHFFGKKISKIVNLNIDLAIKGKLKLLVDTGADVSLIKANMIDDEATYNPENAITLQGMNSNNIRSFGTVKCNVQFKDAVLEHEFHLAPKSLNIRYDGIIGTNFFDAFNITICYRTKTLKYKNKTIPFESYEGKGNGINKTEKLEIAIPARSTKIIRLPVSENSPQEGILGKCELRPGVYLEESLTTANDKTCISSVINTNERGNNNRRRNFSRTLRGKYRKK